jgi:hypothetical protein
MNFAPCSRTRRPREHLVLRIPAVCGFLPAEVLVLRMEDNFVPVVPVPPDLEGELPQWIAMPESREPSIRCLRFRARCFCSWICTYRTSLGRRASTLIPGVTAVIVSIVRAQSGNEHSTAVETGGLSGFA